MILRGWPLRRVAIVADKKKMGRGCACASRIWRWGAQFRFPFTWSRKPQQKDQSANLHIGCWPQQKLVGEKVYKCDKSRSEIEGRVLLNIRAAVPLGFKHCALPPPTVQYSRKSRAQTWTIKHAHLEPPRAPFHLLYTQVHTRHTKPPNSIKQRTFSTVGRVTQPSKWKWVIAAFDSWRHLTPVYHMWLFKSIKVLIYFLFSATC